MNGDLESTFKNRRCNIADANGLMVLQRRL